MSRHQCEWCLHVYETTKKVWDSSKANHSKVDNAAQIYEIKMAISNTKQGNYSVNEYAHTLHNLWQELC